MLRESITRLILVLFGFMVSCRAESQTLSVQDIARIKEATVYVKVRHKFLPTEEEITTSGTGFFINEKGFVATNYHVIQNLVSVYDILFPTTIAEIKIIRKSGTQDYKTYKAFIYSVDKENDLAILGIRDTAAFPFLKFHTAASALVETTPVWAFGYPFGEDFTVIQRGPEITVTQGNLSALRHDDHNMLKSIQVDATVNPGNSGGPLVNEKGDVIGIINKSGRETRMNFAVPVFYLDKLLNNFLPHLSAQDSVKISISTDPPGARVFVDWKEAGTSPVKELKLTPGWHTVSLVKNGYRNFMHQYTFSGEEKISVPLVSRKRNLTLSGKKATGALEIKDYTGLMKTGKNILLKENFEDVSAFEKWDQNTGGDKKRTWYLEDGMLQQHEQNGTLHAISLGDSAWKNYAVKTRMMIGGREGEDPRAGIIFRETAEGFYLFRIHRSSNKAQLAYHCKQPFGWNVIMEKKLEQEIAEKWHDIAVYVSGNNIICMLDSVPVFNARAAYAPQGKIGFYSVESRAVFDDLSVTALDENKTTAEEEGSDLISFWFSDNFDTRSHWWSQYVSDASRPSPWVFSDAGCAQLSDDELTRFSEFTRYNLNDFSMVFSVTFNKSGKKGIFNTYFRKTENDYLAVQFLSEENKISLVSVKNGEKKVLKSEKLPEGFFSKFHSMKLTVSGEKVICRTAFSKLLEYKGRISGQAGSFGFSSSGLKLVLHDMNVSSVTEADLR